jgi:3-hydroxybutyryl-CoA dehydrogenase
MASTKWGLDVVLDIEEHYAAIHPELPMGPRDLLRHYIGAGRLGLKAGKGFYTGYQQQTAGVA